jgi:PAS domain S-box-containing protein
MLDGVRRRWEQSVSTGEPFEAEYLLRGSDSAYRWFLSRAVALRDDDDKVRQWLGTSTDIDARKRAEADLQATNETLGAFVNACPLAVMVLDETGTVQLWNRAAERLYGWSASEVLGRYLPAIRDDNRPDFEDNLRRMFQQGETMIGADAIRYRKDGLTFFARVWTALLPARSGRQECISIVDDVTEEKRAEAALRESEARFRTMADHAPVLIWIAGTKNEATWFNRPWLEFTGRTLEQEEGYGWADSIHPDDRSRCLARCNEAFERREPFEMEFRLRRHDGEFRWILDHGVPLLGPDGTFNGYIGSCIDITERRRVEQALRESEERLRLALGAARRQPGNGTSKRGKRPGANSCSPCPASAAPTPARTA